MRYVYFTKTLQALDVPALIAFVKEAGLDGVDLAVRPGYPVHPENAATALPDASKAFRDAGQTVGLVSAPTNLIDPETRTAQALFDAAAKARVPFIKIGYFAYQGRYDAGLADAQRRLAGFARLSEKTGVRTLYHTHSGAMYGNNAAGLRLLLQTLDAHHVGAFVDTGHTAVNGGPFPMELDLVHTWLSAIAIKDMRWERTGNSWQARVVPAGDGIVRWPEVAKGTKEQHFTGTISLHGEYETRDLGERQRLARREQALLKKLLG